MDKGPDLSSRARLGAFAPHREPSFDAQQKEDVPFLNLLLHGDKLNANDTEETPQQNGHMERRREDSTGQSPSKSVGSASNKSSCSNGSVAEDYVMVQLVSRHNSIYLFSVGYLKLLHSLYQCFH